MNRLNKTSIFFLVGAVLVFGIVQALISAGIINSFWSTIVLLAGVMAIVSLGLNLIYGFNGQFSLGQYGFYAIGAYTAADITYRWVQLHSASGLTVILMISILVGLAIFLIRGVVSKIRGMDTLSAFALYLAGVLVAIFIATRLGMLIANPVTALFNLMPEKVAQYVVYLIAVLLGGLIAGEVSFLFGLPVLTLGSDYFGIATLGFTIIVKVLLDNSDTMLGFDEMKGARGMIGIPKITTWATVFIFLLITIIVIRNLLNSSYGRAIVSIREDETAATSMGIDVAFYKTITFVIGSFFGGLAGGLYAHINGFLHPNTFSFVKSFDPLIVVVFGGLGSVTGTVGAAFGWALVLEGVLRLILPEGFETWRFVIYPTLLLIMMLLKPNGLFGNYEIPFIRSVVPPLKEKKADEETAKEVA
ncbi:branched-chain amino acid ABC transporter permease [Pelolinea submarina]|uniref:Branched-chain amino acid transport system permease protein n=1 Tax=Pelolinea submarina TaxID=913107 RepID=A0A347ZQ15_9CHLR|nr:branched-chain amino acid ABC transporter permease [Pelolinea submarina]REG06275.1 branched-chain amino acid transport system permease protein [Pelolinea submarina]BBB47396.1 branched-chain amino acid transport system permease protein [Pelolinea submarina]